MSIVTTTPAAGRDIAAWRSADLARDMRWMTRFDEAERADLLQVLRAGQRPGRALLGYRHSDFPFGQTTLAKIRRAVDEAQHGLGVALLKGFPREGVTPDEFELLTWAVDLHVGVARPQDKMTRYINRVQDAGTVYRSPTGRGYSSNAELDFHVDGADIVLLSCFNQAPVGGDSMCASSTAAWRQLLAERPDLAEALLEPLPFSRQGEQAEGLAAFRLMPVYGEMDGEVFCMWVRNRVEQGEKLPGAPRITAKQREAMDLLDEIVRRPAFMYSMRLEPGDLQILSNFTALHSRTQFQATPSPRRSGCCSACGWPRPIRRACRPAGMASTNPPNPAWCEAAPTGSTTTTRAGASMPSRRRPWVCGSAPDSRIDPLNPLIELNPLNPPKE
ncbi:TauD/TfdA family dioxygenase [Variovorax sp. LjRoot178]|uniref:TauD/TfdA family dioxygenase n=1 Tax=Variovorax sp. LjRoot178 TaxID=3342277 RepID=UPI003ED01F72